MRKDQYLFMNGFDILIEFYRSPKRLVFRLILATLTSSVLLLRSHSMAYLSNVISQRRKSNQQWWAHPLQKEKSSSFRFCKSSYYKVNGFAFSVLPRRVNSKIIDGNQLSLVVLSSPSIIESLVYNLQNLP